MVSTHVGDAGVLRLLGMRYTVGTAQPADGLFLLPPSHQALMAASAVRNKPQVPLTVAARARAKHAHRSFCSGDNVQQHQHQPSSSSSNTSTAGSQQQQKEQQQQRPLFFGIPRGSQEEQNEVAHQIVRRLLDEAAWINIHTFAGTNGKPSLEVRVASGYGARWVADWKRRRTRTRTTMHRNVDDDKGDDNEDEDSSLPLLPVDVEFRGFLEPQMENGHERGWRH